jgi:hypothetical protein
VALVTAAAQELMCLESKKLSKPKIAVIIGSIRLTRQGDKPAKWLVEQAKAYGAFDVELIDLIC